MIPILTKSKLYFAAFSLCILALHAALVYNQASRQSGVFDEPYYAPSGYALLNGAPKPFTPEAPPAGKIWIGASWLGLSDLLPQLDKVPGYATGTHWVFGPWVIYGDPSHSAELLLRARVSVLILSLMLATTVWFLARRLFGEAAGAIALLLYAVDPLIVANAGLATIDLPCAAAMFVAIAFAMTALNSGKLLHLSVAGIATGVALGTKATGLIVLPVLGVLVFAPLLRMGGFRISEIRSRAIIAASVILIGGNVLTLVCMPTGPMAWWNSISIQLRHINKGHQCYAFGEYAWQCWSWYFPVAWLAKTPVPILISEMLGVAFIALRMRRAPDVAIGVLLMPVLLLGIAINAGICNGLRQVIAIVPFLAVAGGGAMAFFARQFAGRLVVSAMLLWATYCIIAVHPNAMTYSNEVAGGPTNTWKILTDSNVDWGQGLPQLAEFVKTVPVRRLWLDYFGTALPSAYGIGPYHRVRDYRFKAGTTILHELDEEGNDPAGRDLIAVSATCLIDVYVNDRDLHAWLRDRTPVAWAGNSIAIYDITNDKVAYEAFAKMATRMRDDAALAKIQSIIQVMQGAK